MADPPAATALTGSTEQPRRTSSYSQPVAGRTSFAVGLIEASLDSPTFRAVAAHVSEQIDVLERWLESHVRATAKIVHDVLALEESVNLFLSRSLPPMAIADGMIDPDYTLLALKRVGNGQKEWWTQILSNVRRMEVLSCEPVRLFLNSDLRSFKEARRVLELTQRSFDAALARYVSQSKTKEASSLREDAFVVYEARKAYLKASMDFCQLAPQLRYTLDKLLVQVSSNLWKDMNKSHNAMFASNKIAEEMDRVQGWAKEMEASEAILKRELQAARRDAAESTVAEFKPSRDLEVYSASTVPYLGSKGPVTLQTQDDGAKISEKQGWLFLKTIVGKPARTTWIRRWYYCRNGIFGWLAQGPQGVLQGDEIGVLLCNAKPALQEDRRFCFEIKTKSLDIMLQAETQSQLVEWLEAFETAKKHALDVTMNKSRTNLPGEIDPAFAVTSISIPEFSAKSLEHLSEDGSERASTLPVPGPDGGLANRASIDVTSGSRRAATGLGREEGESGREHAARIIQKLDLHRKNAFGSTPDSPHPPSAGIAGLITASHSLLPGNISSTSQAPGIAQARSHQQLQPHLDVIGDTSINSLAPATLAKSPVSTNLSRSALTVSNERAGDADGSSLLPVGVVANYWGSSDWAAVFAKPADNTKYLRLDDDPFISAHTKTVSARNDSSQLAPSSHVKSLSGSGLSDTKASVERHIPESFPPRYPQELRAQHPQFRLLFPNVPLDEKLVLVFNAAWSSTGPDNVPTGQDLVGGGRVYVTPDNMYFYGSQMGLCVAYTISLDIITEVTTAPGRDCDYIFLHLGRDGNDTGYSRITLKIFLLNLALLQSRLNLLIDDLQAEEPMDAAEIVLALKGLESEQFEKKSPSAESWEEIHTPVDGADDGGRRLTPKRAQGFERRVVAPKFQLPTHPVVYEPNDMQVKVEERHFEISAKACFHVLFGDKSFIFPKLYFERRAKEIAQGPWELIDHGRLRRIFHFKVDAVDMLGRSKIEDVTDYQTVDIFEDHITYVVSHVKTPWHLPHTHSFNLITKVVITHVAKSKCKMAIYTKVDWVKAPPLSKGMVQRQGLEDAKRDAEDLGDVATDQIRKMGPHSRTKRAMQVYGNVGQQTQTVIFTPSEAEAVKKPQIRPRTLTAMIYETQRSWAESAVTSILMWTFGGFKTAFSIINANRLILLMLIGSLAANLAFTGKESSSWYTERRAARYMSRLGVGPNTVMSKAIYLHDLVDATGDADAGAVGLATGGVCLNTFQQLMNSTDLDLSHEQAGASSRTSNSRSTARRIRRGRQRLGSYRHDLVVAMRVVNTIEKELVQSEWENWLADETARCEHAGVMLRNRSAGIVKGSNSNSNEDEMEDARLQAMKEWHSGYCGNCKVESDKLLAGRKGIAEVLR